MAQPPPESSSDPPEDALAQLLKKAEQGDRTVLPQLRAALAADSGLWRSYGDLALQAEAALVQLAAGANLLLAEALQRKLQALKDEVGGRSSSPLERLLVERVSTTWLQLTYYDCLSAQATGASEARLKLLLRQQESAHRRHLAALRTLATVRKLLTPSPSPLQLAAGLQEKAVVAGRLWPQKPLVLTAGTN
jgi:hypothetical protein